MSNEGVNEIVNTSLDELTQRFNKKHKNCTIEEFNTFAFNFLGTNISQIGNQLRDLQETTEEAELEGIFFIEDQNNLRIYQDTAVRKCCVKAINISGIPIGIDKIDHFFGNGSLIWKYQFEEQKSDMDLSEINTQQEHSIWGLFWTKVKSYGDLNANWSGLKFYNQLISKEENGFFHCQEGEPLKRTSMTFDIDNYIYPAWSEAFNFSTYADKETAEKIAQNLDKLGFSEQIDKRCDFVLKNFKAASIFKSKLISPVCLNNLPISQAIETFLRPSVEDVIDFFYYL
jgi:hypothetical protein